EEYAGGEDVRVLIVLLCRAGGFTWLGTRSAMAEFPEKLSIAGKFHDGVATRAAGDPDVAFAVYQYAVFGSGSRARITFRRPAGNVARSSPALEQIAFGIEFENRGCGDAAVGSGRIR